ncbi:MAG TPA: type II toxin-antitoxin system death-on-curing family toxin [Candidatus Saccharimonadales bacterium]|nr:type II toxin-antitoxin system death-on-curing family toxin [Candidatus Saccharimonadales bacterium]
MIRYLTEEEILLAHFKLIERYGGSHGVRDTKRIESVAAAPKQEVFGAEQYPDIFEKAAVYLRSIIGDHPFADGNKRTGIIVAIMFLKRNGKRFRAKTGELEDFAVRVATKHLDMLAIAAWLEAHCN